MKNRYAIQKNNGVIMATAKTFANAEKKLKRLKAYRCGRCGNYRTGAYACRHGRNQWVCSAEHYNTKIIDTQQEG